MANVLLQRVMQGTVLYPIGLYLNERRRAPLAGPAIGGIEGGFRPWGGVR
jgi:hypothetical protein